MKKFLIAFGGVVVAGIVGLYLAFLFYLPKKLDLSPYKTMVQKLAKEQADLDVNFNDFRIITAPDLSAGIQLKDLTVKLPDGSILFSADSLRGKVFIPSIFTLTAKISCLEVQSPRINLDIKDGKQYKVVLLVEKLLNEAKDKEQVAAPKVKVETEADIEENKSWFNPEWVTIKLPAAKIYDYQVKIDDPNSGHFLKLVGDELVVGYKSTAAMTKQRVKVKTFASLYSDASENITANIDINTFIPTFEKTSDNEDDPAEKIEIPFVNPVLTYRTYDFKTNIDAKMKVRSKDGLVVSKGHVIADDISMYVKGLKLPTGFVKLKTDGTKADFNTNFYVAKDQNIRLALSGDYGKSPYFDTRIVTDKIYFNDLILLAKGLLDTMQIKNNLADFKADGYLRANTEFVTDFKKMVSKGGVIVRDGALANSNVGLLVSKINANLSFDKDKLVVRDTYAKINEALISVYGRIDENANLDLEVKSEKIPLPQFYKAFAPKNVVKLYDLSSGNVALNLNVTGVIKEAFAFVNVSLSDLALKDNANNFTVDNGRLIVNLTSDFKTLQGKIINKDFRLGLPKTSSKIEDSLVTLDIGEGNLRLEDTVIKVNEASKINVVATVQDYLKKQNVDLKLNGSLATSDLLQLVGDMVSPFVDARGSIPVRVFVNGHKKRMELVAQAFANSENYFTPIKIDNVGTNKSVLQAKVIYKGNRLNVRDTGLFTNPTPELRVDGEVSNVMSGIGIFTVDGTVASLNTPNPFINIIKVRIPQELHASLYRFKNSSMNISGKLNAFGQLATPVLRGGFAVSQLSIPDLYMLMQKGELKFDGRDMRFLVDKLLLNHSDFDIAGIVDLNRLPHVFVRQMSLNSSNIDLDRLLKVVDAAMKFVPQPKTPAVAVKPENKEPADIPVTLRNGTFLVKNAKTGNILASDIRGKFEFLKNILYITDLNLNAFKGAINGNISVDALELVYKIALEGSSIDVDEMFRQAANMKDTLSGTLAFKTDLTLGGTTFEEQVKSLVGTLTFLVQDGQFGPFGKFENMLLAENIRESEFFKNSIGGILNSMLTIDTTHFESVIGHLDFKDGMVEINPITTLGNVMALHLAGGFDILGNSIDMKVRGRLASMVTNVLGPIAQLNPINVVKATPGVDYLMLKAFALFCEEVTQEEMDAIPSFEKEYDNASATKFQVVLRGDVAKPLSLVKSFKWLAVTSEMEQAKNFMETLPPPTLDENGNYVLQDPAVYAEEQRKANTPIGKIKKFFSNLGGEEE